MDSPGCLSWIQHGWKVAVPVDQSSLQQLARVSAALHSMQLGTSVCVWSSAARVGEDPLFTLGFLLKHFKQVPGVKGLNQGLFLLIPSVKCR